MRPSGALGHYSHHRRQVVKVPAYTPDSGISGHRDKTRSVCRLRAIRLRGHAPVGGDLDQASLFAALEGLHPGVRLRRVVNLGPHILVAQVVCLRAVEGVRPEARPPVCVCNLLVCHVRVI